MNKLIPRPVWSGLFGLMAVLFFGQQPVMAQSSQETALARAILTEIQPQSIDRNREYCGLIGWYDGALAATEPRRGRRASCRPHTEPAGMRVVASYHTHAGHSRRHDSEVPSVTDVQGDMDEGIDGYVATPGGRFWYIDGDKGIARLICDAGCLPSDPDYDPADTGPVATTYSLEALQDRFDE